MTPNFQNEKRMCRYKADKSHEQQVDKAIRKLCKKINRWKEHYTTSSCSGRIVLVKDLKEKIAGIFLFKTHNKIKFSQLRKEMEKAAKNYAGLVYFRQEPCILHVVCKTLENAMELLNKAQIAGWKRSGIIASKNRIVCELMSTEKLELPTINQGNILVNDKFLRILVKEANKKLEKTWEKIQKFEKFLSDRK